MAAHFHLPEPAQVPAATAGDDLRRHIRALWPALARRPGAAEGSLLPLGGPFVVPGGRFAELYYWDSYFTLLGLVHDGETALAAALVDRFTELVERHGHIPNGTRSYYLGRSQPPLFFAMDALVPTTSHAEDVVVAAAAPDRPAAAVWRALRAAAESGWDFSSRWLGETGGLAGIRTTAVIPVDLNAFL